GASRHGDLFLLGRPRCRAAVHLRDRVHGDRAGALPAPLLLSRPHHQAVPQAADRRDRAPRKLLTLPAGPAKLPDTLCTSRLGTSASTFTSSARSAEAL